MGSRRSSAYDCCFSQQNQPPIGYSGVVAQPAIERLTSDIQRCGRAGFIALGFKKGCFCSFAVRKDLF